MQKAIEYAQTIESWDDLVDPHTLAFYCLRSEPSAFFLCNLKIEGKRVSVDFVSTGLLIYISLFFFFIYLFIFLQVLPSCRNDDQVQQGYVREDEIKEG